MESPALFFIAVGLSTLVWGFFNLRSQKCLMYPMLCCGNYLANLRNDGAAAELVDFMDSVRLLK